MYLFCEGCTTCNQPGGKNPRLLSWVAVISEWVTPRCNWTLEWRSWVCCCLHTAHPWVQGKSAFRSYFWTCNYVLFCFVFRYKRQSWATRGHLLWPVGHWQEQSSETGQPASALTWLEWCPPRVPEGNCEDRLAVHCFFNTHTQPHTLNTHAIAHLCTRACTISL